MKFNLQFTTGDDVPERSTMSPGLTAMVTSLIPILVSKWLSYLSLKDTEPAFTINPKDMPPNCDEDPKSDG